MLNYLRENKEEEKQVADKNQQKPNWRNDPLLFDPEVEPSDSWLTANELIEANHRARIFLKDNCLNIYPILIRRIDFVRRAPSDRILSRFPYAILSPEERKAIQKKELLIAECCRNFFCRSIDSPIKSWQARLHHYLDRGAIPYPLLRCAAEVCYSESIDLGRSKTGTLFESAKREKFTLPLQLSEDLAYLCGVVDGDGHLDQKGVTIVDSSQEHIINLRKIFEKQFGSLKRLGFNYVDLYLVHWPAPGSIPIWKVMEKILQDGKARAIGVSNFIKINSIDIPNLEK